MNLNIQQPTTDQLSANQRRQYKIMPEPLGSWLGDKPTFSMNPLLVKMNSSI